MRASSAGSRIPLGPIRATFEAISAGSLNEETNGVRILKVKRPRMLLAAAIVLAFAVILSLDPGRYLDLAYLKAQQATLQAYVNAHPFKASGICFLIYTAATAMSIPGAFAMTLAAGAVFGVLWGTFIVSFASTCGATLAFLMARYLFRGFVQARFGHHLGAINRGITRDGPIYLLTLRLIPIIPFIGINLLMALTPISMRNFYLYSQIGMLPATVVFVNAGTQLARIENLTDIASTPVLVSFALLAIFPFIVKAITALIKRRRFRAKFPPPLQVDRNIIVIGAGSAGLVAAYIAASVKAKVTLIEQNRMGGDCLNTGCVPSKALIKAAKQLHQARVSDRLGILRMDAEFDFSEVMQRIQRVVKAIEPHDSVERYRELGVECIHGRARLVSPYAVEINGQTLSARAIVLATGASPAVPPIPGLADVDYLTSDTLWQLRIQPERLLILGGGPISCELAQAFQRLGSSVTVVEMAERLLPREDPEISDFIQDVFEAEGIVLKLQSTAVSFSGEHGGKRVHCQSPLGDEPHHFDIEFDQVVLALGRRANVEGYGLEELGVPIGDNGAIDVNDHLQTHLPTVFACGDVAGPYQFTHTASHQAWYATVNALFGGFKRFAVDYRVIPWCTFTDPEVAHVGLNEREAQERGTDYELTTYGLDDLDRAITDGNDRGFVRVLTAPGNDRILGVTIVGEHAGDLIAEFILAMKHNLGLNKILRTIHIYPTLAEANKAAAGAWRRAHTVPWVMTQLERFHRWRREGRMPTSPDDSREREPN